MADLSQKICFYQGPGPRRRRAGLFEPGTLYLISKKLNTSANWYCWPLSSFLNPPALKCHNGDWLRLNFGKAKIFTGTIFQAMLQAEETDY